MFSLASTMALFLVKPSQYWEEKERVLGLEPATEFLPPTRKKSGNNMVYRHRISTRLMFPGYCHCTLLPKGGLMQYYYLGVDVSKGYADFVLLDEHKRPAEENFQLDDTFEGHCYLYQKLHGFLKNHPDSIIHAGVESTGGYENNWFNSLIKFQGTLDLETARLNPYMLSHHSKADLNRIITDKISARNVAEYMIAHPEKVTYQQHDYLASLRKQWGFIKMLTKQKTQLLNQLESLLYNANPELLVYCKDGVPKWVFKLLNRYPTALQLSRARATSVSRIPYISAARARELIARAKRSVASATDAVTGQLIVATVKEIAHLKKLIEAQMALMVDRYSVPEVDLLKTFKGMNDFSAIGLLLEIQTTRRFPSVKKLSSFFGLHPVYKISGDGRSGFRMSKKGRKTKCAEDCCDCQV